MARTKFLKRYATPLALAGTMVAVAGAMAFAASFNGPYAYEFSIPGGGNFNCTTQTRTASAGEAPNMQVEMTQVVTGGGNTANFTAGYPNRADPLVNSFWSTITTGTGYQYVYAHDKPGQSIKLMGGTGYFQGPVEVKGYWKT